MASRQNICSKSLDDIDIDIDINIDIVVNCGDNVDLIVL